MTEDSGEMIELYGRGVDGKLWVMNGHLVKKEVKKEKEEQQNITVEGIEKKAEMVSGDKGQGNVSSADASSVSSSLPSLPSPFNAIIHPLNVQPQLSLEVEERQSAVNGGDSLADELQQLKDALKSKELLNSMLLAKLEQVKKEKNEEQRKNAHLVEELKLAKEKPNNMDKETETEATIDTTASPTMTTTLQPLRAVIAAQLLGVNRQLLDEPQQPNNEWKEKFEQLNSKYRKVKQMYRTEQKVAARLRKELERKEMDGSMKEQPVAQQDDADQVEPFEPIEAVVSSPIQNEQLFGQQMDVGEDGRRMQVEGRGASRSRLATGRSSAKAISRRPVEGNSADKVLPTTGMKKKKSIGGANTVVTALAGIFKCAQCPPNKVAFSSAELLAGHQKRCHAARQHYRRQCPQCGLACLHNAHLQVHMRTHTGEKPFPCRECGRGFAKKGDLTTHERTHTDERPYVCSVCAKAFNRNSHLVRHSRLHTGETPFLCQHCARPFTDDSHCRWHEKTCPIRAQPQASE